MRYEIIIPQAEDVRVEAAVTNQLEAAVETPSATFSSALTNNLAHTTAISESQLDYIAATIAVTVTIGGDRDDTGDGSGTVGASVALALCTVLFGVTRHFNL